MADGKHCPACGRDVGVWPVLFAWRPNRVRCPHCSARLTYRRAGGVALALVALHAAGTAGAVGATAAVAGRWPLPWEVLCGGLMLGSWFLVARPGVWFVRSNRTLAHYGDPSHTRAGAEAEPGTTADGKA